MSNPSVAPQRAALHRRVAACGAALAVALLISACAMPTHPDSEAPPSDPFNPAATQLLDDTSWVLASWQDANGQARTVPAADAQGALTLALSTATGERRASGYAGCNRFGGAYQLKSGKLSMGPLMATRMACTGTRNELERAYLDALAHIGKVGVQMREPQQLDIVTSDGATLHFARATQ
ncbi:META domain-containing protein [Trinickia fusca]|uniref:META domain-containing protein n=1 Tax=Trinickia fusca TaxID=2419777 RepID=A0A494X2K2_9BURK|nr:META domain-containing protein [Trinickia fusca]RKP44938.1 META domain-containing protein [Trinickia fusca]